MQKIIFILRIQKEMSIKDIADYLNIKEGTVKSHLNRVFSKLRKKYLHEFKELTEEVN